MRLLRVTRVCLCMNRNRSPMYSIFTCLNRLHGVDKPIYPYSVWWKSPAKHHRGFHGWSASHGTPRCFPSLSHPLYPPILYPHHQETPYSGVSYVWWDSVISRISHISHISHIIHITHISHPRYTTYMRPIPYKPASFVPSFFSSSIRARPRALRNSVAVPQHTCDTRGVTCVSVSFQDTLYLLPYDRHTPIMVYVLWCGVCDTTPWRQTVVCLLYRITEIRRISVIGGIADTTY